MVKWSTKLFERRLLCRLNFRCPTEYPPTHQYNTFTMKPSGPLKERLEIIESEFGEFFKGHRLLDVASNWGFFSFHHAKHFEEIVGIDVNSNCILFCNKRNRYSHLSFEHSSFRDYSTPLAFDKIFVGNVAHHLFMDVGDWSWLAKLHAFADDQVLIEGAESTCCKDIYEMVPKELHCEFNKFEQEMSRYFDLVKKVKTTSYTPNRYLMLYKKKNMLPKHQLNSFKIKKLYSVQDFKVFETENNTIVKVYVRDPRALQIWSGLMRIRLASNSSVTNNMTGEVYVGSRHVGWTEAKLPGDSYKYFENEKELWNLICQHNIFLSKNGYVDLDTATINFNKKTNLLYDKSCVFAIKNLLPESVDVMPILFNQSYMLCGSFFQDIVSAIKSQDSKKVESSFRKAMV